MLGAVAAVAAVVAIGLGVYAVSLADELDDTRTALEQQEEASAILADPSAETVELQAGDGSLVVAPGGDAVLVVDGLAPAPADQTYQAWVIFGDKPVSAGTFESGGARTVVPLDERVGRSAVVAVTLEPAGGVDAPTSTPIVASAPA